ncbi:MAG: prepilin-type N-terminal cleavage/methylation domain-containing protein, partial [Myxococcota bacterium]
MARDLLWVPAAAVFVAQQGWSEGNPGFLRTNERRFMFSLRNLKSREGFTLIELMIVVAIIGILAAIAIPNFLRFQLRSKAGEGKVNLAAIRTAEEGYFAEFGTYIQALASPAAWAGGAAAVRKVPWLDAAVAPNNFGTLGWAPEGDVYFQYQVNAGPTGLLAAGATGNNFYTAEAQSDLDGDGPALAQLNIWGYVVPDPAPAMAAVAGFWACPAAGAFDPIANANVLLQVVGPCLANMGQSIF